MSAGKNQPVLGVLAMLVLVAAVAVFYVRNRETPTEPMNFKIAGVCLACQKDVDTDVPSDTRPPLKCPSCGEQAVYGWQHCAECNKLFVAKFEAPAGEGAPRPERMPACIGCGSKQVGGFDPEGVLQDEPAGRLPLPTWPWEPPTTQEVEAEHDEEGTHEEGAEEEHAEGAHEDEDPMP